MRGSRLIGRRDYSGASATYERILARDRNDWMAVMMLSFCYERQNRLAEARQLSEEAVRQMPTNLPAQFATATWRGWTRACRQ